MKTDEDFKILALEIRVMMMTIGKISRQVMEQRLAESGMEISGLQCGILHYLSHEGDHTLSELSKKFILDPSTLVPVVDSLARKGLVKRGRDPNDRRRIPLSITGEGADLIEQFKMISDDDPALLGLQKMGDDDARQLLTLLRELVRHLPDGEELLESVQSRMDSFQKKESL
jgi:DNA-binding MarR family transcriptional regulator